jgi:hypothetical protein
VWDLTETIQKLPLDMKVGYVDWKGDMIPLDYGDIVIRKVSLNGKPYLCLGTNLSELKGDD